MTDLLELGLDIETTGFLAPDHRIVEVYAGIWRDGKLLLEFEHRIDPERSMPAEAQRVHGITSTDLIGKPKWEEVGPQLLKMMNKADLWVGHNGNEFDFPFLKQEFERIGLVMPDKPKVDTMLDGIWATHDGKKPRLEELCFACGIAYDQSLAHAAAYDVRKMMECYHTARTWGFYQPSEPEASVQAA